MRHIHLILSGCVSTATTVVLAGAACLLLLAQPAAAVGKPAAASAKTMAHKSAAMRSAWAPETLSGTITAVDPAKKLVVLKGPDGVPFDMVVTGKTRINSGDQTLTVKDLTQYENKPVSLKFVPERRGDVAESIRIGG